jgi:hypothetical protein
MQYKQKRQTMLRNPWNGTFSITVVAQSTQCGTNILRKKNTNVKLVDNNTADIQEAQHDNVCLTRRIAVRCTLFYLITLKMQIMAICTSREELQFYFVHLRFTAQVKDHPHRIAAIMMICTSMEELQFYFVHLYFTAQGEDHAPLNCCNHDNACFYTQELQFYFVHFCFTEQVIPH